MYGLIIIVHLLCACIFIGTVFFEVVVMSFVQQQVDKKSFHVVETALGKRLFSIMPWILLLLVGSGLGLLHSHYRALLPPWQSSFGILLACKLILVVSVLLHFFVIKYWRSHHTLTQQRSLWVHRSVLIHVFAIAILAKAMFYWAWS